MGVGETTVAMRRRSRESRRATPGPSSTGSDGRWTPAQAAGFAAKRDFMLLQLLATDRRAFTVARRLSFMGLPVIHGDDTSGGNISGGDAS